MKKTFKRAGVAVLSMAMLLSMGAVGAISANAAISTTVTIPADTTTKIPAGANVTWYKVAESGSSGWAWEDGFSITTAQATALNSVKPAAVTETVTDAASIFTILGKSDVTADSAFVKKLATILDDKTDWTTNGTGTVGTAFTISDSGNNSCYYLAKITTSDASYIVQPILFELTSSTSTLTTATPKASKVTLDKIITNVHDNTTAEDTNSGGVVGDVQGGGKKALASANDTVSYQISTNLPVYESSLTTLGTHFVITDTMTNTLSLNAATVTVKNTTDNTTLAVQDSTHTTDSATIAAGNYQYSLATTTSGFTVTLSDAYVLANPADNISVEFSATITATPNYGATSNDNTAKATFGNNFETGGGSGTTPDSTVNVYCAKLEVTKTDGTTALPGAGFTLYVKDSSNNYVQVGQEIVNTTGNTFNFPDLTKGSYKLVETTVPANHSKGADIEFIVTDAGFEGNYASSNANVTTTANSGIFETTVINTPNGMLPGTGGIGTTLFTVGGAAIILFAGVMFVLYMRKRRSEEE